MRGWSFWVYVLVRLLGRECSAWLTPTAGENYLYSVRVGQLSLCSQVLLRRPSHAGAGNAPHKIFSKTAEFRGCSLPHPMWHMRRRVRGGKS